MKVALLNTYDTGGAATATKRLHRGLREIGVESYVLVQQKEGDEQYVLGPENIPRSMYGKLRVFVDSIPVKLYGDVDGLFTPNWLPDDLGRQLGRVDPDIVHLNWVSNGFFRPKSLCNIDVPIVWRLPDMWPLTGGCHYSGECTRYTESCGACPRLGSDQEYDLSRWTWQRRNRAWKDLDITIVATTSWLAECANESSLFGQNRIEVIPNALDTDTFCPVDPEVGRRLFGLSKEKKTVLFGGVSPLTDSRKGFDLLEKAIEQLEETVENDIELVVFGVTETTETPEFEFDTRYVEYLHDNESLAVLYAASDVMIVPSRYEGFGQTVSESLSCGTPVVAFDGSGPSDIIDHKKNGYLATPYDPEDLACGIRWVLNHSVERELSNNARKKAVEEYSQTHVATQYQKLYKDLI